MLKKPAKTLAAATLATERHITGGTGELQRRLFV